MEHLFADVARSAALLVEMAAVFVVSYGALESFAKVVWIIATPRTSHGARKELWRGFGMWLLLGLEFELAADIIGSVISPSWQDIGQLGAIAVIRTFLNYFLGKDLEEAEKTGQAAEAAVATVGGLASIPSVRGREGPGV